MLVSQRNNAVDVPERGAFYRNFIVYIQHGDEKIRLNSHPAIFLEIVHSDPKKDPQTIIRLTSEKLGITEDAIHKAFQPKSKIYQLACELGLHDANRKISLTRQYHFHEIYDFLDKLTIYIRSEKANKYTAISHSQFSFLSTQFFNLKSNAMFQEQLERLLSASQYFLHWFKTYTDLEELKNTQQSLCINQLHFVVEAIIVDYWDPKRDHPFVRHEKLEAITSLFSRTELARLTLLPPDLDKEQVKTLLKTTENVENINIFLNLSDQHNLVHKRIGFVDLLCLIKKIVMYHNHNTLPREDGLKNLLLSVLRKVDTTKDQFFKQFYTYWFFSVFERDEIVKKEHTLIVDYLEEDKPLPETFYKKEIEYSLAGLRTSCLLLGEHFVFLLEQMKYDAWFLYDLEDLKNKVYRFLLRAHLTNALRQKVVVFISKNEGIKQCGSLVGIYQALLLCDNMPDKEIQNFLCCSQKIFHVISKNREKYNVVKINYTTTNSKEKIYTISLNILYDLINSISDVCDNSSLKSPHESLSDFYTYWDQIVKEKLSQYNEQISQVLTTSRKYGR